MGTVYFEIYFGSGFASGRVASEVIFGCLFSAGIDFRRHGRSPAGAVAGVFALANAEEWLAADDLGGVCAPHQRWANFTVGLAGADAAAGLVLDFAADWRRVVFIVSGVGGVSGVQGGNGRYKSGSICQIEPL